MKLNVKYVVEQRGSYYFKPPPELRAVGFVGEALGTDPVKAAAKAQKLYQKILDYRAGQYDPLAAPMKRTIADVVQAYIASDRWPSSPTTQTQYRRLLALLLETKVDGYTLAGRRPDTIRPLVCSKLYREWSDVRGLRMANYMCDVYRAVWNAGIALELVDANPWATVKKKNPPRRTMTWTDDQLAAFVLAAEEAGQPGLALLAEVAFDIGVRTGDLREMTWSEWTGQGFSFRSNKTNTPQQLNLAAYLAQKVNSVRENTSSGYVFSDPEGDMYTNSNFGYWFRKIREKCGLPNDLQFRDIRRTVGTELLEAGADVEGTSRALGHSTTEMVDNHYNSRRKANLMANAVLNLRRQHKSTLN